MDSQAARHLFNEIACPTVGVGNWADGPNDANYEEIKGVTPFWGVLIGAGAPTGIVTGHTEETKALEDRRAAADFLRDWADAIEGIQKESIRKALEEFAGPGRFIDIVFDGPPGPEGPRFVEVENDRQQGVSIGEWLEREKYHVLRIPFPIITFKESSTDVFHVVGVDHLGGYALDKQECLNIAKALNIAWRFEYLEKA